MERVDPENADKDAAPAKKTSQIEMKGTIIGSNSAKRSSCVIFSITLEKRKQGSERKFTKRTRSCEAV